MGAAEACNEVVFEGLDGLFGCISVVDTGGTNWQSTSLSMRNSLSTSEHSLSSLWSLGLRPACLRTW